MRWLLVFLVACSGSHPHEQPPVPDAPVADASTIDSSDEWFARMASGVTVGPTTIAWSELEDQCGLETGPGCHGPGPMITVADAQGQVSTLVTGMYGATGIAGDETGWFYVDRYTGAIMRVGAGGSPAIFAPAGNTFPVGPVVDASSVYWFETGVNGVGRGIMRASRTGDGSDVTTIAQPFAFQDSLYLFGGDVWWWACTTTCEVYRASSQTPVRSGAEIVGADANAIYLVEYGTTWNLIAMASDGTTTTLLANQPQQTTPQHLVADGGDLFWSSGVGIYRAQPSSTPTLMITPASLGDEVFAVMPTQILYDFTPHGYAALSR